MIDLDKLPGEVRDLPETLEDVYREQFPTHFIGHNGDGQQHFIYVGSAGFLLGHLACIRLCQRSGEATLTVQRTAPLPYFHSSQDIISQPEAVNHSDICTRNHKDLIELSWRDLLGLLRGRVLRFHGKVARTTSCIMVRLWGHP